MSYNVPEATLRQRAHGVTSRRDSTPNLRKLTSYEELALIQYILDLNSRGFPPRLQGVQEMADLLLSERGKSPVHYCPIIQAACDPTWIPPFAPM